MYQFLNGFFFVFHTAFTLFNIVGWIFPATRKWHLATILLTAFSWFVMGIWYGWGYCICTDWHYEVRERLGHQDQGSYIRFLIDKLTGVSFNAQLVDNVTVITFFLLALLTIWLNLRDYRRKKRKHSMTQ